MMSKRGIIQPEARMTRTAASSIPTSDDILSLLPEKRRQEILAEALGGQLTALMSQHQSSSFGVLVEGLVSHPHWDKLRHIAVASVLRPSAGSAVAAAPKA